MVNNAADVVGGALVTPMQAFGVRWKKMSVKRQCELMLAYYAALTGPLAVSQVSASVSGEESEVPSIGTSVSPNSSVSRNRQQKRNRSKRKEIAMCGNWRASGELYSPQPVDASSQFTYTVSDTRSGDELLVRDVSLAAERPLVADREPVSGSSDITYTVSDPGSCVESEIYRSLAAEGTGVAAPVAIPDGYCYLRVLSHEARESVMAMLGSNPTFAEVLALPACVLTSDFFGLKVQRTAVGMYHLSRGNGVPVLECLASVVKRSGNVFPCDSVGSSQLLSVKFADLLFVKGPSLSDRLGSTSPVSPSFFAASEGLFGLDGSSTSLPVVQWQSLDARQNVILVRDVSGAGYTLLVRRYTLWVQTRVVIFLLLTLLALQTACYYVGILWMQLTLIAVQCAVLYYRVALFA